EDYMTNISNEPEWWRQEVYRWVETTGWPSMENDLKIAQEVYESWKTSSSVPQYGGYRCTEMLMDMMHSELLKIHPSHHDAAIITVAMLFPIMLQARREGYARRVPSA